MSSFVKLKDSCQHELSLINTQLKDHIDLVQKAKSKLQVLQHDLDVIDVHLIELKTTPNNNKGTCVAFRVLQSIQWKFDI